MEAKIKKAQDGEGVFYPVTRSKAVFVSDNETLETRLSTISAASGVSELKGKVWNALGDSVTRGEYNITPNNQTPVLNVKTYHQHIGDKHAMTVRNYGIGGTRITATADSQGFCQRYTAMDNNADIITVFGGINDYTPATPIVIGDMTSTDTATLYGAMKALCAGLIEKYPGKALGFIIPYPANEYKGVGTFKPYRQAIIDVCEYYSIPYLDLYTKSNLNSNITTINNTFFKIVNDTGDKTHPNTEGHKIIARQIEHFLLSIYKSY